jgi:hypothetical protein
VAAGLTGINAYDSTDPDNAFSDGPTSPREYFDDQGHYRRPRAIRLDFAVTIAAIFDAHLAAVAFAYAPDFPGYVMLEIPPDIVAQMIAESEKAALAAIERFEAAARRSLISAEHRLIKTAGATAPVLLSALARRFDLSVLMQSEPNRVDNDDMIETTRFESGRPLVVVPYIQKDG